MIKIIFYTGWNGFVYYYLLSGDDLEYLNSTSKTFTKPYSMLFTTGYIMLVCSFISLVFFLIFMPYLKSTLLNFFCSSKPFEISVQRFAKAYKLLITQQSENYFKERDENDIEMADRSTGPELAKCIICYDKQSEVVIKPCGHSGMCRYCMVQYLKSKNNCPHCKQQMTKIFIIYYDPENKIYITKGTLKFKINYPLI